MSRRRSADSYTQENTAMFALRIVTVDHYQSTPLRGLDVGYSEFRSTEVKQVPVIRVFGATPAGQKTCLHLHGVFPYIYVPYDGTQPEDEYLHQFAVSLDKAINVTLAKPSSFAQHVYKVIVVSGIPFYGYHPTERDFLKVYFFNPSMVKRAVELLQNGAVMNKIFQPHEAHIPYILQTFIDYNLYGMNLLQLASVKFRSGKSGFGNSQVLSARRRRSSGSLDSNSSVSSLTQKLWNAGTISNDSCLPEDIVRQSTCELEVDALSTDVLNRNEVISNPGVNPGLAAIWEDEQHRRRMRGVSSQITPPSSQDRESVVSSESDRFYKQQLLERLANVVDGVANEEEERMSASVLPSYTQAVHVLNEDGSQRTQPLNDITEAVIDEELAVSQSFSSAINPSQSSILDSQDEALIRLVIDGVHTQSMCLNTDEDSILCSLRPPSAAGYEDTDLKDDDFEALEMSQQIWETDQIQEDGQKASQSSDEEMIPQVDGPNDPKSHNSGASRSSRYRLGPNGHALTARKSTSNSLRIHPDVYETPGHHFYQTVTHVSYSAGGMYQPYPPPASSLPDPWPYRNYNLWNTNPAHSMDLATCHAVKPAPTHINVPGSQWSPKHSTLSVGESSAMDASNPFSDILQPTYNHPQFSQELPLQQGFNCYQPQLPYYNQSAQRTNANVPVCDYVNTDEQAKHVQPSRTLLPTPQPLSSTGFTCVELTSDNGSKNYISLQRISSAAKDYQEIWPHDGIKDHSEAAQYGTGSSGHDDCMLQESYSSPNSNYIASTYEPPTVSSSVMKDKSDTVVSSASSCNLLYGEFQCEPISPAPTAVASPVSDASLITMPSSEGATVQCLTSAVTTASSLGNWNSTWNCGTATLTPLGTSQTEDNIESDAVVCTAALSGCQMSSDLDVSAKEDNSKETECEEPSGDNRQISIVNLVCDIITSGDHLEEEEEKHDNTVIAMDDAVCHEMHDCETAQPVMSEVPESFECPCATGMDGDNVLIQSMSPSQIPLSLATVEVETASRFMQRTPVLEKMASFVKTALHQINTDRSSTNSVSTSSPYSVATDSPLSITSASGSPFSRSSENSSPLDLCQSQRGSPSSDLHKWNNRTQVIRNLRTDPFTLGTNHKGRSNGIRGRGRPRRENARKSPPTSPAVEGEPLKRKRGRPPNKVSVCRPFDLSKATYIQSSSDIPQAQMKLMRNVGTNVHPGELLPHKPQGYYGIKYGDLKVFVPRYVRLVSLLKLGREKLSIPRLEKQLLNPNSGVSSLDKIFKELKLLKQQFSAKHSSGNSSVPLGTLETKVKTKIRLLLPSLLPTRKNCIESKTWTLQPQSSQKGLKIRLRSRNDSQLNMRTLTTKEDDYLMQENINVCSDSLDPSEIGKNHQFLHTESRSAALSTNSRVHVDLCYGVTKLPSDFTEAPSGDVHAPSKVSETCSVREISSHVNEMACDFSAIPSGVRNSLRDVGEADVMKACSDVAVRTPNFMETNSESVVISCDAMERTSDVAKKTSEVTDRTSEVAVRTSEVTERTSEVTETTSEVTERTSEDTERTSEDTERTSEDTERTSEDTERNFEVTGRIPFNTARTSGVIETTSDVMETTSGVVETTGVMEATSGVMETTSGVMETTSGVMETTSGVMETTSGVVEKTSAVIETTSGVVETTSGVMETTSGVMETTSGVMETTSGVMETTSGVMETTSSVMEKTSDVTKTTSDVTKTTSDVTETASDVTETASDVMETASDFMETASDVMETASDVMETTSDVMETTSDVMETTSNVMETTSNVMETTSNVMETTGDVIEKTSDVIETSDVLKKTSDVIIRKPADDMERACDVTKEMSDVEERMTNVTERTCNVTEKMSDFGEKTPYVTEPHLNHSSVSTAESETPKLGLLALSGTKMLDSPLQLNEVKTESEFITADVNSSPCDTLTVAHKSASLLLPTVSHYDEPRLQQEINMSPIGVACNRSRRQKVDYNPHAFTHIWNYDQIAAGSGRSRGGTSRRSRRGGVKFKGCRSLRVDLTKLMIPTPCKSSHFNYTSPSAVIQCRRSKLSLKCKMKTVVRKTSGFELQNEKCWQLPSILSAVESNHRLNHDCTADPQAASTPLQQPPVTMEVVSLPNGAESNRATIKYELRKSRKSISFFPDVCNTEKLTKGTRSINKICPLHEEKRALTRRSVSSRKSVIQHKPRLDSVDCWSVLPVDTNLPAKNIKKLKIRRSTPETKSYHIKQEKPNLQMYDDDDDDDFEDHYFNLNSTRVTRRKIHVKRLWTKNKSKQIKHFVQVPLISRNVDVTELSNCASDISSIGDIVAQNENGSFVDNNSNESKESENLYFGSPPRLVPEIDVDQEIKLRQSELPPLLLEEEEELEFDSAEERTEDVGSDNEGLEESLLLSDLSDDDVPRKTESNTALPSSTDESFCNSNELNIRIESVYSSSVEKFDRLSPCPSSSDDDVDKLEVVRINTDLLSTTPELQTRMKGNESFKIQNACYANEVGNANAQVVSSCRNEIGMHQITAHTRNEACNTVDAGNASNSADASSSSSQDLFPSSFDLPPILIPLECDGFTNSHAIKSQFAPLVATNMRRAVSENDVAQIKCQTEKILTLQKCHSYDNVQLCLEAKRVKNRNMPKQIQLPFSKQDHYKPLLEKQIVSSCVLQPNLYPNTEDKTPKKLQEVVQSVICQQQPKDSKFKDSTIVSGLEVLSPISPTSKEQKGSTTLTVQEISEQNAKSPQNMSDCENKILCDYDEEKDLFGSDSTMDESEENSVISSAECADAGSLLKDKNESDLSHTSVLNNSQQKQNVLSPSSDEPSSEDLTPGQRIVESRCDSDTSPLDTTQMTSTYLDSTLNLSIPSSLDSPQLTYKSETENSALTFIEEQTNDLKCSSGCEFVENLKPDQCTTQYGNNGLGEKDFQDVSSDIDIKSQSSICKFRNSGDLVTNQATGCKLSSSDQLILTQQSIPKPNESKRLELTPGSSVTDTVNDCHSFIASLCTDDENSSLTDSQCHSANSVASFPSVEADNKQHDQLAKTDLNKNEHSPKCTRVPDSSVSLTGMLDNVSDVSNDISLGLDVASESNTQQFSAVDEHKQEEEETTTNSSKSVVEQSSLSSLWNVESVMNLISESVMQQKDSAGDELVDGKLGSSNVYVSGESCIVSQDLECQEAEATLACILQQIDNIEKETSLSSSQPSTFSVNGIIAPDENCETMTKRTAPVSCSISCEVIPNVVLVKKAAADSDKTKNLCKNYHAGNCTPDATKVQEDPSYPINKISTSENSRKYESSQDVHTLQNFYEDISSDSLESYLTDEVSPTAPPTCSSDSRMSINVENEPKSIAKSIFTFRLPPPTREEVLESLKSHHIPQVRHQKAFYGNHKDPLDLSTEGKPSNHQVCYAHITGLPECAGKFHLSGVENWRLILATQRQDSLNSSCVNLVKELRTQAHMRSVLLSGAQRSVVLTPCISPPQLKDIQHWVQQHDQFVRNDQHDCKTSEHADMETATARSQSGNVMPKKQDNITSYDPTTNRAEDAHQIDSNTSVTMMANDCEPVSSSRSVQHSTESPPTKIVGAHIPHHSTPTSKGTLESLPFLSCTPIPKKTPESAIERVCKMLIKRQTLDKIEEEGNSPERHKPTSDKRKGKRLKMDINEPSTSKRPRRQSLEERCGSQYERPNTPLYKQLLTTQIQNQIAGARGPVSSTSQLDGPTPNNSYAFKVSYENLQDVKAMHEHQFLTVMSLELHIRTRHDLHPDPAVDPICAVFFSIHNDVPDNTGISRDMTGSIILDRESWELQNHCKRRTLQPTPCMPKDGVSLVCPMHSDELSQETVSSSPDGSKSTCQCQTTKHHRLLLERAGVSDLDVRYVPSETSLLEEMVQLVHKWDPDILVGYEIEMLSWGYLLQRSAALQANLQSSLSRLPAVNQLATRDDREEIEPEVLIKGRVVLNLWRLMRSEAPLTTYSLENVAYHILHQRIPTFSFRMLTKWFDHPTDLYRYRTVKHYVVRVKASLQLMQQLDLVGRTSELARLFGIQFYEVLSRGSQFRVESMMLRMAKPLNFVACSPSIEQRSRMRAPECLALIMEPESKFYSDPVVVLDFQSLYPSMMIAYNYCYSTCLGKVDHLGQNEAFDFGCTSLRLSPTLLKGLSDHINISPVGVAFVKSNIRQGVLPRMLEEILETRIMVKKAMKDHKRDKALTRVLDARQLGLKLIANVTYGYTSANFSGRMPCVEVGDSVVSKARETLESAIQLVKNTPSWEAEVVYGDTDSMFIHLPGRSKEEAFRIGQEIADAVTAVNPKPVKLKFEKVYLPCVLQTKKRYVGNMYESVDQKEATFDAKGIETVRRDGCPAVVKILEKSLRLLFSSRDVSQVKAYVQNQLRKLLIGRVSLQDYTFAREYRGLTAYKPAARVPALEIAKRIVQVDRRREPRIGERVPYVIVYGSPGEPLFQLVRQPQEVMIDENLRLNSHYYINNVILPPLERIFKLMDVDVYQWYARLPRPLDKRPVATRHGTIAKYFTRLSCCVCNRPSESSMCSRCQNDPQASVAILTEKISHVERSHHHLSEVCRSCTGMRDVQLSCISLDCPVFYRLAQASRDLQQVPHLKDLCTQLVDF